MPIAMGIVGLLVICCCCFMVILYLLWKKNSSTTKNKHMKLESQVEMVSNPSIDSIHSSVLPRFQSPWKHVFVKVVAMIEQQEPIEYFFSFVVSWLWQIFLLMYLSHCLSLFRSVSNPSFHQYSFSNPFFPGSGGPLSLAVCQLEIQYLIGILFKLVLFNYIESMISTSNVQIAIFLRFLPMFHFVSLNSIVNGLCVLILSFVHIRIAIRY